MVITWVKVEIEDLKLSLYIALYFSLLVVNILRSNDHRAFVIKYYFQNGEL